MKNIKPEAFFVLSILLTCIVFSFANGETAGPDSAPAKPEAKDIWIDVRTPKEFKAGHIKGAVLVPHTEITKKIATIAPQRDQRILLYCAKGGRAEKARKALKKMGYTNVSNEGGYKAILKRQAEEAEE